MDIQTIETVAREIRGLIVQEFGRKNKPEETTIREYLEDHGHLDVYSEEEVLSGRELEIAVNSAIDHYLG